MANLIGFRYDPARVPSPSPWQKSGAIGKQWRSAVACIDLSIDSRCVDSTWSSNDEMEGFERVPILHSRPVQVQDTAWRGSSSCDCLVVCLSYMCYLYKTCLVHECAWSS
jgi:hypothetical protein